MLTQTLRLLVLAVALAVVGACHDDAPSAEWLSAKAAYDAAMAEPGSVSYLGPRWDDVLAKLRLVPSSHGHDHRLAQALIYEIERTRGATAAQLKKGDEVAQKLLDFPVLPGDPSPPPGAAPTSSAPPSSSPGGPQAADPAAPSTNAQARMECLNACHASFWSCLEAAGCKKTGDSNMSCEGDAFEKGNACRATQTSCDQGCPP